MGLTRLRFSFWLSVKLNRLADGIKTLATHIHMWGKRGHMACPICGDLCHMQNICVSSGTCIQCSPPVLAIGEKLPDVALWPDGDLYVLQGQTTTSKAILKSLASSNPTFSRYSDLGNLYVYTKEIQRIAIQVLRSNDLEVSLYPEPSKIHEFR